MLNSYSILPEYGLLWKRHRGNITRQYLANLNQLVNADKRYCRTMTVFEDLRGVRILEVDYDYVSIFGRELCDYYGDCPATVKFGICAPGDLAFGLGRMFQTLVSDFGKLDVGVFREVGETLDFLEVPEAARTRLQDGDQEMGRFF